MSEATATAIKPRRRIPVAEILRGVFGAILLLAGGFWLIGHAIDDPTRFYNLTVVGLSNGMIYGLVALGYTLVYGIIELINFAHGDNFMLATFQTQSMIGQGSFQIPLLFVTISIPLGTAATQDSSALHKVYAIGMTLILTMAFCAIINVSIERIGYKPLRNAARVAPLITAIGFSFVLQGFGLNWKGPGQVSLDDILPLEPILKSHGLPIFGWKDVMVTVITIPVLIGLTWLVKKSKSGKAMRATAQDRSAAAMMGIDVNRTISFTFALGGALAGAGGLVYMLYSGSSTFQLGFRLGLFAFTAAVLGGIGNLTGAVLGAGILGLISSYSDGFGDARWTYTIVFAILILILVFRPSGILGEQVPEGQ